MVAMLFTVLVGLLLMVVWNKLRTTGKTLCLICEEDKSIKQRLLPGNADFVIDVHYGEAYYIFPERVRLMRFPAGWPSFLQENVPALLVNRGDGEPLDWNNLSKRVVSALEVGAAMEPQWLKNIVKGVQEGAGGTKLQRIMPLISVALGVICMLILFYLIVQIGGLEHEIGILRESVKLGL